MSCLLAVDLGLRTGLALFDAGGHLVWYRSQNFGRAPRLRRAVHGLLANLPGPAWVILEGGGPLADIWARETEHRGIATKRIAAEDWRRRLLYPRQQRNGRQAKHNATDLARRVIEWSGAPRPTTLRHDTAEAILIGLWGVLEVGWLTSLPGVLRP